MSGSVGPRGWQGGDEELPVRHARVQVRHQRQDRHGQQGKAFGFTVNNFFLGMDCQTFSYSMYTGKLHRPRGVHPGGGASLMGAEFNLK